MPWVTPVTNWTSTDVYNYTDINRVEGNIDFLRSYLVSIGYPVNAITVVTNRINTSYDTTTSINRLDANLEQCRVAFITPLDWVYSTNVGTVLNVSNTTYPTSTLTPQNNDVWNNVTKFTHIQANRWESNTLSLYTLAQLANQSFKRCGTFNAGQVIL